jgi:cell division septum initiation protein DivIVA
VTDNRMRERVRGLWAAAEPDGELPQQTDAPSDPDGQRRALQVLTLAQRTAEDHVAGARQQAATIQGQAQATAEQIVADAQARAEHMRREAERALLEARATAVRIAREAEQQADKARREADEIVSKARAGAAQIARDAEAQADELKRQAQQRYDNVVGTLAAKREALQQQIEALEHFDHDYRALLTSFVQAQLRALWVDEPQVRADIEQSVAMATTKALPALQAGSVATTASGRALPSGSVERPGSLPAQRSPSRRGG